jgi:hypothetical protein
MPNLKSTDEYKRGGREEREERERGTDIALNSLRSKITL